MPRAALVEDSTNIVTNVAVVTNTPPSVPGFQWIMESNWAAGQQPSKGDVWDGTIPASFTPQAPIDENDLSALTPAELIDLVDQKTAEIAAANAELQRQLSGA